MGNRRRIARKESFGYRSVEVVREIQRAARKGINSCRVLLFYCVEEVHQ